MAKALENPRKKAIDAISKKIALFMVQETYTDEEEAQKLLNEAMSKLDKAAKLLVASDVEATAKK